MRLSRRLFIRQTLTAFFAMTAVKLGLGKGAFAAPTPRSAARVDTPSRADIPPTVISVHSPGAADWDFKTYPYVDHINHEAVKKMLDQGMMSVAGGKRAAEAWRSVFSMYRPGDTIAIKPNLNDLHAGFKGFVTSPSILNALLDGLVNAAGVQPRDIIVYDCTREIPDEYRERISFPVNFAESFGSSFLRKITYHAFGNRLSEADPGHEIRMTRDVRDKGGHPVKCYLPRVITSAAHVINVPILKSHRYISNSGALKNHYGTVRFSDGHTGPEYLHPPIIHESIADINGDEGIRGKTRLVVMDALFGRVLKKGGPPDRWNIFGGMNPGRILLSRDPVALDSVAMSFVEEELASRGERALSHEYLHLAHDRGIGVHEDPDSGRRFRRIAFREIEV